MLLTFTIKLYSINEKGHILMNTSNDSLKLKDLQDIKSLKYISIMINFPVKTLVCHTLDIFFSIADVISSAEMLL